MCLRGASFLSPDTRSEGVLRGLKFFPENLRGMKLFQEILRGMKLFLEILRGMKFFLGFFHYPLSKGIRGMKFLKRSGISFARAPQF